MLTSAAPLFGSLLALAVAQTAQAADYSLVKQYSGDTFFDDWIFTGHYDNTTNGDVIFVNQSASADLAYVNDAGNVIIKVDNTSVVPYNEKRNTVKITTKDSYGLGTLWIFDATHSPYGCSVWPAYWSQAEVWPAGGEIDIFEGVNLQSTNQYALHTSPGCTSNATTSQQTGDLTFANCDSLANYNNGCSVVEANDASYGAAFAAAGGGVYATQLSDEAISIWFFSRADVPADLANASATPDPSSWGTPSAYYPNSGCDLEKYFQPQKIIIDITLCGDWAGANATFQATCSGVCYNDYVLNADSYNDAYFEISSLRIYSDGTDSTSSINVTSTTSNETTTSGTDNGNTNSGNTNGGGNSSGSSDAVGLHKTTGLTAGAVLAALAWAAL